MESTPALCCKITVWYLINFASLCLSVGIAVLIQTYPHIITDPSVVLSPSEIDPSDLDDVSCSFILGVLIMHM